MSWDEILKALCEVDSEHFDFDKGFQSFQWLSDGNPEEDPCWFYSPNPWAVAGWALEQMQARWKEKCPYAFDTPENERWFNEIEPISALWDEEVQTLEPVTVMRAYLAWQQERRRQEL